MGSSSSMKLITLYLPPRYIKDLDRLVKEKMYPNRAVAIRNFIRDGLLNEVWMVDSSTEEQKIILKNLTLFRTQQSLIEFMYPYCPLDPKICDPLKEKCLNCNKIPVQARRMLFRILSTWRKDSAHKKGAS